MNSLIEHAYISEETALANYMNKSYNKDYQKARDKYVFLPFDLFVIALKKDKITLPGNIKLLTETYIKTISTNNEISKFEQTLNYIAASWIYLNEPSQEDCRKFIKLFQLNF